MYGLDLFSGIGGITKALEGYVEPVAYCERERWAQAALLSRMATGDIPLAPIWDDVTTLRGTMLPPVDIIYGGFPCQDISVAGRGKGLDGERSGLFFEIVRLVGEVRPRFVFLENVTAINVRGLDRVLAEFGLRGYDCRGIPICASEVGAPMHGHRWFLLASSLCQSSAFGLQPRNSRKDKGRHKNAQEWSAYRNEPQMGCAVIGRKQTHTKWLPEPSFPRMVNGLSDNLDRIRALGNAVVPAQAREAFERLMGLK